jgi:hypothetical protein
MATTDKTRDKLLASMRKSKTGAGSKPPTASTSTASKKTTTRRQATRPAVSNKAAATMGAVTLQVSTDAYQSSGRVWPD